MPFMLNLSELALIKELRSRGWHPSITRERLAVHLTHPDGRPVKIASAFIVRRPGAVHRPWTVAAPGLSKARACRTRDEAVALFMTQLRLYPPASPALRAGASPQVTRAAQEQ